MNQIERMKTTPILAIVLCSLTILNMAGCETDAQTGGLAGAGIGALIGQAAGGDTEATLIGAAVGGGIGYIIGNEEDKKQAEIMSRGTETRDYRHNEVGPLGNTRWQFISLAPSDYAPPYTSKIIEFRPYGRVVTTTTDPNGEISVRDERYRVVGSTLIINEPGMLINARFDIQGDEMVIDAEEFRAVLRRLPT